MSEPTTSAGKALLVRADTATLKTRVLLPDILAIESEAAAAEREKYRFGWCCDFDFDNGTYRTTDCISRTRNADVVESEAAAAGARAERERLRDAAEADADALARMLNEACWSWNDYFWECTQCGSRQPEHTVNCPTKSALAAHDARRQP